MRKKVAKMVNFILGMSQHNKKLTNLKKKDCIQRLRNLLEDSKKKKIDHSKKAYK